MKTIFLLIVISISLVACSTVEDRQKEFEKEKAEHKAKYEAELQRYVGQDVNLLISDWGVPTKTLKVKDTTFYEYDQAHRGLSNTTYNMYTGFDTVEFNSSCSTTFVINNHNKVVNWKWHGHGCHAPR